MRLIYTETKKGICPQISKILWKERNFYNMGMPVCMNYNERYTKVVMVQKNELDINKNNILTRNKSLSRRVRFSCVVEKNVDLIVNLPLSQKLKLC